MRRVGAAARVIDHPRPVGLHLVQHFEVADRLVGHGGDEVPAGAAEEGLDWSRVAEQIAGLPLTRVVADEAVVIIKALDRSGRPFVERACLARIPLRHVVVLAVPGGGVAALAQNFADCDGVAWDDAVVAGKPGRLVDDNAGANRMVIAAGEQRGACRRAECCGVEPVVAQPHGGDAIERRGRDDAALDKVWVTGLNGTIGVMDFDGRPIGKETDFPFAGKVGGLQGVGIAANGDVWIADATKNQLLYFPGGRVKDGRLVQVKELKSPFGIAIDAQNRVWVSNAQSDTVVRFPADDPSKVESFRVGIGVRGVALDSKGNLWVT
jgi:hypothetical protein